jgi:hypothetical protein
MIFNLQEFIESVSDKVVEYLRDNKTQDMQEVRNIIALHFSSGLEKAFYDEEADLAKKMEELIAEQKSTYTSSRRNSEINSELLKLSQKRRSIRKKATEAMDAREFVVLKKWLRNNHSEILDVFYATQPKKEPFAKLLK